MKFLQFIFWLTKKIFRRIKKRLFIKDNTYYDFISYKKRIKPYQKFLRKIKPLNKGMLIVSGRGMNTFWAQIWTILSLAVRTQRYLCYVITTREQENLNRYFKLLKIELIFYEDIQKKFSQEIPYPLKKEIEDSKNFNSFRNIKFKNQPIGEIALSTVSRHWTTGVVDINDENVREEVIRWIKIAYQARQIASYIFDKYKIELIFGTELFFEEYSSFYYEALLQNLNIIKFTGTVRDCNFLLQHMSDKNERLHHASLSKTNWNKIKQTPFTDIQEKELEENFLDRYSAKWHRSIRNNKGTKIVSIEEAKKILSIKEDKKIAIIFSHILYDCLFFFGKDLFNDYSEWLVETVKAACENDKLIWFVKVHPSNLWRGELDIYLKGKYEEERLIQKYIGDLPDHVRIIKADNPINPFSWFQLGDYCITVRGTSGLEMAALGKVAITAGTGRYEGNGFTIDPISKHQYIELLKNLHDIPMLKQDSELLAKRYAHALFCLKPIPFNFLETRLRSGVKEVIASDDLIYLPVKFNGEELPNNLTSVSEWIFKTEEMEMLNINFDK